MKDPENMESESIRIAHLTMIQGVVTRMASNSFTLKALAVSFVGAWLAVMATTADPSIWFLIAAVVPVFMFWILDAQYLRLERLYRKLYEDVRVGDGVEAYSMDFSPYAKDVSSAIRVMFSWSVSLFYLPVLFFAFFLGSALIGGSNA